MQEAAVEERREVKCRRWEDEEEDEEEEEEEERGGEGRVRNGEYEDKRVEARF